MATNIGPAGTFTTANMKPASGEQADALWAQNLADNTGYLRARQLPFMQYWGTNGTSRVSSVPFTLSYDYPVYIQRVNGHNYIQGTMTTSFSMTSSDNPDFNYTHGIYFFGNLGTHSSYTSSGTHANLGSTASFGSTFGFSIDMSSYLSEGSWGTLVARIYGTASDFALSNTFTQSVSIPPKVWTYWG
jgi:hypothetical protein